MKKLLSILIIIVFAQTAHAYTLFEEHFESVDFSGRDWYDVASSPTRTNVAYDGSYSLQCLFNSSGTNCTMGDLGRHLFTATDEVYISVWVRPSSNWQGSGQTYHPHLFMFMTNMDTDYWGPSVSRLTTYVELNNVTARMNAQDSTNIDQNNVGVNLCAVTEARAANGCNGNCDGITTDCYGTPPNARNEKVFAGSGASFNLNAWNHIEAYIKLNTISGGTATSDGIMRYWLNGTQVVNQTAVMLRTGASSSMQYDKVILAPWIGDGSPVSQYILIDDLVIGTERPARTEYYVEPSGAASWPTCTSIDTACSATTAMNEVIAGDTVYFRGGSYYPDGGTDMSLPIWYPHSAGTSTQLITIRNYPGETPIIYQPLGANSNGGLGAAFYGYIVFDGFQFIKRKDLLETYLWHCYETSNITIRNSEFAGIDAQDGHNHVGVANVHCDNLTVENNYFHGFRGASGHSTNIGATWFFSNIGVTVVNNTFEDCDNGVATKVDQDNIEAYHNFFLNVDVPFHWQTESANSGFSLHNNVAVIPSGGTFMYSPDPTSTMTGFDIYNNTVYCAGICTGIFFGNSNGINVSTWNNIFYGAAGTTKPQDWSGNPDIDYTDYNTYYSLGSLNWDLGANTYTTIGDWRTASGFDSASTTTSPLISNPGGTTPEDYKRTSYPSDGRGGIYDTTRGAYITGTELIGYQASSPTGTITVTGADDGHGTNTCTSPVVYGATTTCTNAPDANYHTSLISGCSGTWTSGNSYTTGAITSACTVTALNSLDTHTVTPSAGANGSISPDTAQLISYGSTTAFSVTADPGWQIQSVTGCSGSLVGSTYTTGAITTACTVSATFSVQSTAKQIYELSAETRHIMEMETSIRRILELR